MEPPLVSVIVPTRDRPGLVAGAVRSALEQQGALIEVCVVDDGSSRPVVLPVDLAADQRVELIRFERPRGAAAARNAGIAATRGDLIAFLDDDDMWLPGKLRRQIHALHEAGPGTVMVACGFELWDEGELVASRLPSADVNASGLLAHPCMCPSATLARRDAIETAGGFDESLLRVEDWELWLRMSDLGTVAIVPEVLVDRRSAPITAAAALEARRALTPHIEPRLARLPSSEAGPLRARFRADDAILLADLGCRRAAMRLLLAAWGDDPRSRAAPVRLARTLAGERAWAVARRVASPLRARVRSARRPPRPPGPAPRWAAP